jgi:hypothetical protein
MADATVTLGLNAAQLTAGLKAASGQVDKFASGASASFSRLSASLGVLGGGFTLGAIVKQGFSFNQTMQDGEVAIGNVLKTFKGLNDEAAKSEAAKVVQLITEAEPRAAGGLQELTQGFIATAAAAAGAGISAEQNVDLVARFANALSNSGLPLEQLNQELRSVLTANVTSDSFIGKLLEGKGLDNKRISQLTQEGKLYGEIVKELGAMGEAGDTAGVAFSTLNSALSKAAGALTADMFSSSVSGAKNLSAAVDANIKSFEYLGSVIGTVIEKSVQGIGLLAEFFQFNNAIGTGIGEALTGGSFMEGFKETMDGFKADAAKAVSTATAQPGGGGAGSGGSGSGSSVTSTLEKQKKGTYDIAKNLQEQANAANSILAPYKEFLNFLDEAKRKQDAIDSKKDADRKATQSKIEGQKEAAQALQDEIDLLTVRATGDEKAIRDAEAALAIKQRARQIQRDMNVDAKTSMGIAQQIASLEQKGKRGSGADTDGDGFISKREQRKSDLEQKRGQRKADSIKGFSRGQKGLRAFGGLREFYGMQVDREWMGRDSVGSRFYGRGYGETARSITSAGIKDRADQYKTLGMDEFMIPLLKAVEQLNTTMNDKLTVD